MTDRESPSYAQAAGSLFVDLDRVFGMDDQDQSVRTIAGCSYAARRRKRNPSVAPLSNPGSEPAGNGPSAA
jgi:hypothetical protein